MKIRNEQLIALQENEARRKSNVNAEQFEAVFAASLGQEHTQGIAPAMDTRTATLQGLVPASLHDTAGIDSAKTQAMEAMQVATGQVEQLFASMETYAQELSNASQGDLKKAYSLLESMSSSIASLKASYPAMAAEQPQLAAIVNELDVLATTERFKLNRGDYLLQ